MFNFAKKFLKIYDFYKKSNKINDLYILDYVHKSLILKAFINFDKKLRRLCCKKRAFCLNLQIFDVNKTEYENMSANGYYRQYDCGNYVFEYSVIKY